MLARQLAAPLVLSALAVACPAEPRQGQRTPVKERSAVAASLQDCSVTVRAGGAFGSGVIKTRDGIAFVWTAAHVVADLRSEREVVDAATGVKRTVVEFRDAAVIKTLTEAGRTVGRMEFDARVLRYSDAEHGEDLALLMIRKRNPPTASVRFYADAELPAVGAEVYHVGSLLGPVGAGSLTAGIISRHGRLIDGKVYDQVTAPSFPGSSGGGVFLKDGRYVGMLVRGAGETFGLIIPVRRMNDWARRAKVEWALRDDVPAPGAEELERGPVEEGR
jgi:S1-C subfamily serine protease